MSRFSALEGMVSERLGGPWRVHHVQPMSGGIHEAMILHGAGLSVFVKVGRDSAAGARFACEIEGLVELGRSGVVRVPRVLGLLGGEGSTVLLLLEAVKPSEPDARSWEGLGASLAALHGCTAGSFGLGQDNYIGMQVQSNRKRMSWPEFYAQERLVPQLRRAVESGRLEAGEARQVDRLIGRLDGLCGPEAGPSLLHGDLWRGNVLFDGEGALLIDPAVYYGHREVEIAFARLFGGMDDAMFAAYDEAYPLDEGYLEREALWQVYPLLVHVNHFGETYVPSLLGAVGRYV